MSFISNAWPSAVALFVLMLACTEIGRRIGARRARGRKGDSTGRSMVEGAIFALFGLLIAFTFSGAADRFAQRRAMMVQEANDVSTAFLRLDVLEPAHAERGRTLMRAYTDSRIETYANYSDRPSVMAEWARSQDLQGQIWDEAVAGCAGGLPGSVNIALPALNSAFDSAYTRMAATYNHPPSAIYGVLGCLSLLCSLLAGLGLSDERRFATLYAMGFPLIISACIFVILDIEHPRLGLIRVDSDDFLFDSVREMMGP